MEQSLREQSCRCENRAAVARMEPPSPRARAPSRAHIQQQPAAVSSPPPSPPPPPPQYMSELNPTLHHLLPPRAMRRLACRCARHFAALGERVVALLQQENAALAQAAARLGGGEVGNAAQAESDREEATRWRKVRHTHTHTPFPVAQAASACDTTAQCTSCLPLASGHVRLAYCHHVSFPPPSPSPPSGILRSCPTH